jgi:cAMP phosphodiesterase
MSPTVDEYACTHCAADHIEGATVTPAVAAEVTEMTSTMVLACAKRALD